ncbi:hypothetical protein ACQUSR_25755 [Streptomyces sp. P1-3]|uniref:hypothetical protein n=1 Tax=Streptomyces sp. P1-3 TaxID=3421658 RepID=UPI003D36D98D
MREERKLKLKLVVTARPGGEHRIVINLRLSLQTQHSPPIAGQTGPRLGRRMPVQVRPAQLKFLSDAR